MGTGWLMRSTRPDLVELATDGDARSTIPLRAPHDDPLRTRSALGAGCTVMKRQGHLSGRLRDRLVAIVV